MTAFDARAVLQRQLEIEWSFAKAFVLGQIDDQAAVWSAGGPSCTVHRTDDGWIADWPDDENDDDVSPATIGWILWHIEWWWTNALAMVRGEPTIAPRDHLWSGGTKKISYLKEEWDLVLATDDLDRLVQWVMPTPQPVALIAAWLNFELAKNLAEINQLKMIRAATSAAERQ